jgi:threonine aldolase
MRQAGVIAAAALVAIEDMRDRLGEDHRNAKSLARGLAQIPGIRLDADRVVTNIVSFEIDPGGRMDTNAFVKAAAAEGLRFSRYLGNSPRLRAVTHYGVEAGDIDDALEVVAKILSTGRIPVAAAD